jgi:hypothetical protein
MNQRIKELAKQATRIEELDGLFPREVFDQEKFAELIVKECKENFTKVWYEQGLDIRGAELGKFMTRFEEHFGVEE